MSLALSDISYAYPGDHTPVLQGVSLRVPAGTVMGLTAPSGAGKSTLLRVAGLMLRPDAGEVAVAGMPAPSRVPAALRRRLGIVPQSPRTHADPRLTLAATICAPAAFRDGWLLPRPTRHRDLLRHLCDQVQLPAALLSRTPAQVSDGQLQRALLARALVLNPQVLICDEPTAQLDQETSEAILNVLRARAVAGAAVLLASHDRTALRSICDDSVELAQLQRLSSGG